MSKACTKYLLAVEKFPLKFVWNGEKLVWSLFWHHDFPDLRSEWLWGYKILILSTSQFTWFYSIDEIGNHSFCSKHSLLNNEPFYLDIFCNSIHIVSDLFRSNFSIRFQIWSLYEGLLQRTFIKGDKVHKLEIEIWNSNVKRNSSQRKNCIIFSSCMQG